MKKIVFDIETKNIFQEVGKNDPTLLDISIVCVYDYSTDTYSSYLEDELPKLWPILENCDMLIGYNSDHFDIPLLNKYYPGDLTKIKSLDILKEIKDSFGRRLSLNTIAEGTLGTEKSANGLQAVTWWRQGEIEKIRKYCLDDVKITKEVYDYAFKNRELKFKDGALLQTIKLDPTDWEKPTSSAMTFTLPF